MLLVAEELIERLAGPALAAAQLVVAGVGGDAQQPGFEGAAAEAVEGLVGGKEGVLGGVGGGLAVAEQAVAEVEDALLIGAHEVVVGAEAAPLRGCDLFLLVHALPGGALHVFAAEPGG